MKLNNKVAVITGGGSGIGEAISKAYAKEGATVIIADRDASAASEVSNEIGGASTSIEVDISKRSKVAAAAEQVISNYGHVDILVNNAGSRIIKGFMQHTEEDWDQMLAINLSGPFHCSQAFIPNMVENGGGSIICSLLATSSKAGFRSLVFIARLRPVKTPLDPIAE